MNKEFFKYSLLSIAVSFFGLNYSYGQDARAIYERYESNFIKEVVQLEYNVQMDRVMLKGYSPVSYVEDEEAEMGDPNFTTEYGGVVYQFTDDEQRQKFLSEPEKYIPAYGGYCAYGVAVGKHLDIDPQNFKMISGKTHLFLKNKDVDALELWDKGKEEKFLSDAQANWEILRLLPDDN